MRRAIAAFLAILVLCFGIALASASGDSSRSAPIQARAERPSDIDPANDPGAQLLKAQAVVDYGHFLDRQAVANLIVATQITEIVDYVAAVEEAQWIAAQDALGRYLASIPPPAPPRASAPAPSTGYSAPRASSGGHSDAWWHGVANCEQGGRNDPYFGYFSFMDGSMGGQPWDVQVAAGNAVLARSGSESPAWAPSCVAAGYAASPGG